MTDREAMKMALHALEFSLPAIEDYGNKKQLDIHHEAIMALHKALTQPEQEPFKPDWVSYRQGVADGAAQPEQEEVKVEIGVDVTAAGTSVVAFNCRADGASECFYAEWHPLAKPEQEPKLTDAGADTNITRGLEPKGSGMVALHQPEQDERLRKDANRYRWLKKYISQLFMMTEKQMNEQVDRAMSGGVLNKTPCECIDQFWCATFDRCKRNE